MTFLADNERSLRETGVLEPIPAVWSEGQATEMLMSADFRMVSRA